MVDTARRSRRARSITTREIARLCGVSRSTVSAVLNGKRNIRESTRRKVLECVRRENYHSGMVAKAMVGQFSRMVAVLSARIGDYFEMAVFRGINAVLESEGYHILLHNVRPESSDSRLGIDNLLAYRPAGYIVLEGAEGSSGERLQHILAEGMPVVAHTTMVGIAADALCLDCRAASRLMTDYVIGMGHRRLAHLGGPPFSHRAKERQKGFFESLIEFDIPVADAVIAPAGETAASGYWAAKSILTSPGLRPTALVCYNDMVAIGAYRAAHELGLEVPRALSIAGLDGVDFAELLGPPLTTMDVAPETLGRRSAEMLLAAIQCRGTHQPVIEWIQPRLIERGSVGRAAQHPPVGWHPANAVDLEYI